MRVAFMGTPAFAVPALEALLDHHEVVLVVTQPDRPAGRGMGVRASAVADAARARGARLMQPEKARDPALAETLRGSGAEVLVVAAYGQLLPPAVLDATAHGGINVHASLLPRWRGASPIAAAILAGDEKTGVSIMRMEAGLDTGPVLLQYEASITGEDTTATLGARLAEIGARALLEGLERIAQGTATFTPQDGSAATYAPLVKKTDGDLDWARRAAHLERAVRAYDPWPGVRVPLHGETVRLLRGKPVPGWFAGSGGAPGDIVEIGAAGITVMAADGPFLVEEVQPPGRRAMAAADYARGRRDLASSTSR